jgi:hypothetical protein
MYNNMKVFELKWHSGEIEWIAARTNIEALKCYTSTTEVDLVEMDDLDEIIEVSIGDYPNILFREDESIEYTISLDEKIKTIKTAELIGGTMY